MSEISSQLFSEKDTQFVLSTNPGVQNLGVSLGPRNIWISQLSNRYKAMLRKCRIAQSKFRSGSGRNWKSSSGSGRNSKTHIGTSLERVYKNSIKQPKLSFRDFCGINKIEGFLFCKYAKKGN